ncbi:MAG: hypothetical protein FJX56_04560 [Alphaproteobacteria bacterium]|nr:hypothetical protein [Alphaproteobacteria bacterium]
MPAVAALPVQFAALEPFVTAWALPSENARSAKRWASHAEDFRRFYDAMLPRMPEVLAYLDEFPLHGLPAEARPLYHLALAFAESAAHVELYGGANKVPNSFDQARFMAAHGERTD